MGWIEDTLIYTSEKMFKPFYTFSIFRLNIKVDLPPPVHFSICTTRFPYKTYGGKPHTICMGEARRRGASIVSRIYRPTM